MNRYKFKENIHVHTLDGKNLTGTSSVSSVLAKVLTWWASGLAMGKFGWMNVKESTKKDRLDYQVKFRKDLLLMSPEEYDAYLESAYRAHADYVKQAAEGGTDLHASLEEWVKGEMSGNHVEPIERILPFVKWCKENVAKFLWSEVHTYSEKLWLGGISDLGVELRDGRCGIVDFKSAKEVYFEHFLQDAGYAIQLEESGGYTADGDKILTLEKPISFLAIVPFGAKDITPQMTTDVAGFKNSFVAALRLYQHKKLLEHG